MFCWQRTDRQFLILRPFVGTESAEATRTDRTHSSCDCCTKIRDGQQQAVRSIALVNAPTSVRHRSNSLLVAADFVADCSLGAADFRA